MATHRHRGKDSFDYVSATTLEAGSEQIGPGEISADAIGGSNIKGNVIVGSHLVGGIVGSQITSVNGTSLVNSSVAIGKTGMKSGTVALDGTAQATVTHGLGVTPSMVSIIGIGEGSCMPILAAAPDATNLVLNCTGTGTALWSVY